VIRGVGAGLLLLAACGTPGEPPPAEHPADCARESSDGLRTLCLVQVAAERAGAGDIGEATAACAAVPGGTWLDECHFRIGEELAKAGRLPEGLAACAAAGRFRTFCFTHAAWGAPPSEAAEADWVALGATFADLDGEAVLRARWWFNHVYGTGVADGAEVRAAPAASRAAARGAWALEAVRRAGGDLAVAAGAFEGETLRGPTLPPPARVGRYDLPFAIPEEQALPYVPTFGGSRRLVGETDEEDLAIALLEGAWFREAAGAATFERWLDDPRPRVRYTALRYFRSLPSTGAEARLTAMREDPDPIVRAHVEDALTHRTWEGKGHPPGLRPRE
jgi:hypothetical protein